MNLNAYCCEKVPPPVTISRFFLSQIPLCGFVLIFLSCAGQVAPVGGPPDAIPPILIRTEPDTNAVNVRTDRIVLEFSEYVERRSVEESIFISPYVGQLEFDWSGREVAITFTDTLRSNTTYVLNIGTDVVDIRARNRMANGYTLAFSTGGMIDQGMIKGKVYDDRPEGVMVFAYALDGIKPDTLDPGKTKPDYIMQTGKDGSFTFSNIRLGTYRIIAVRDEYRNLIYDRQIDQFGVSTGDVSIDSVSRHAGEFRFRLSGEDTTRPFLTRVTPVHRSYLQLRFNEMPDSASFANAAITIVDTAKQTPVAIRLRSLDPSDSLLATVLIASPLDSAKGYRLSIENLVDLAGNPIDSVNSHFVFGGVGTADTIKPGLQIVGIRDSVREVPRDQSFELQFSEPVEPTSLTTAISLLDSTKKPLSRTLHWRTASSVLLVPDQLLNTKAWYAVRVVMDSVKDFAGNSYRDSMSILHFQSLDVKTTGTIRGVVNDADTGRNGGDIFLTATKIASSPKLEKTLRLRQPGVFKFEEVPEGTYTLQAYRDKDSSRTYSYGLPFPFHPSERFVIYSDTLKVRARWGVEGVGIAFPRGR